jgi:vancomycin permeability regulator SanA
MPRVLATLLTLAGVLTLAVVAANLAVLDGGTGGRVTGSVDCALVLGAGVRDDGSPSDVLRDRLDEALELYRTGRVTRVIVSGDHQSARYDEPNAMRVYLEAMRSAWKPRAAPPTVTSIAVSRGSICARSRRVRRPSSTSR